VLGLDKCEKRPDILNLYYEKIGVIQPIVFRILISMCFPRIDCGIPLSGKKAVVFEHISTNLMDKDYMAIYLQNVINVLSKIDKSFHTDSEELIEAFYNNLYIIQYTDIDDLVLKVQSLNYILSEESIKLVILDSPNLTTQHNIVTKANDTELDELRRRNSNSFEMDKKAKKSLDTNETQYYVNMLNILTDLQNNYHFNLITLYYDYERYTQFSAVANKINRQSNYLITPESDPGIYIYKYTYEEYNIEFIVKITYEVVKERFIFVTPVRKKNQFFTDFKVIGIISQINDNEAAFRPFIYSYKLEEFIQIGEETINIVPFVKEKLNHYVIKK
jgi:hypothetical protein